MTESSTFEVIFRHMVCILREGVRRNALRVLRPRSPHFEESAQHIEWRDPCGHAAVWLQGSVVQGRHDRLCSVMLLHQLCCSFKFTGAALEIHFLKYARFTYFFYIQPPDK